MEKVKFAGIEFKGINKDILLEETENIKFITTVNAEFIQKSEKNAKFKHILNSSFATFDGQITYYIAKLKNLRVKFEVVSGCDFIYDCCEYAQMYKKSIFLLGGYKVSNESSCQILKDHYNIRIDGYSPDYSPYPFPNTLNNDILKRIRDFRPDFLFVGFGALKQEFWIYDNLDELEKCGVKWVIGSGGTFEFVSGKFAKPSNFLKKIGVFSLVRLIQEPKLFRIKRILKSFIIIKYLFFK